MYGCNSANPEMQHERLPVKTSFALLGWNSGGSGEQRASVFLSLDDWKLRGRDTFLCRTLYADAYSRDASLLVSA